MGINRPKHDHRQIDSCLVQFVTLRCAALFTLILCVPIESVQAGQETQVDVQLFEWKRGFAVRSLQHPEIAAYLWFYEWNMFDAMQPGQHTHGTYKLERTLTKDGQLGIIKSDALSLRVTPTSDGADLNLTVRNRTKRDFPAIAAIIPCFNPGLKETKNKPFDNTNTYYLTSNGLEKLFQREIHFNAALRPLVDREARDGKYWWSSKWPLSQTNATGGLILRESNDKEWVCGIAWEDFLSVQGHNPWQCMHLSVCVGPLAPDNSKSIRGKIYLMQGSKQDLLDRYREDFEVTK